MGIQKVHGKAAVQHAIADAFMSDPDYAEAQQRHSKAQQALREARAALEEATGTLEQVEIEAKDTAVRRELGEATGEDVSEMIKAVDAARAALEEAKDLVEIREEAASILKERFDEARTAAKRRLNREWGAKYREAVEELVDAYHALTEANLRCQQIEYDIQLRTLRLPHPKASWPEPIIQRGGETAAEWISKLKSFDYNGE